MLGQKLGVAVAFAQRRHGDRKDREPIHEILAQLSVAHRVPRIAIGRGDHAYLRSQLVLAADARVAARFQHAKQPNLHIGRHFADFIEEERSAGGALEAAAVHPNSARERALFIAEELRLDEVAGNGAAVHGQERDATRRRCLHGSCVATSSLPLPDSPVMKTVAIVGATRAMRR